MSIWKALLLVSALTAAPLHAETAPPTAVEAPAPDRVAAAEKLMEVMMPASQREAMMGQLVSAAMTNVIAGFEQRFGAEGQLKDPEVRAVFDRFIARQQQLTLEQISGQLPGLFDAMARAYARRFTVEQLGEIEAFFSTPTGQAYTVQSMNVMADPDIAAWQSQSIAASLDRLPAELERLRKDLEALRADAPERS